MARFLRQAPRPSAAEEHISLLPEYMTQIVLWVTVITAVIASDVSSMSVYFEERSGEISCKTAWGSWSQTMEEVFIEVHVPPGTSAKDIKCDICSKQIELRVKDLQIFKVCICAVFKIQTGFEFEFWKGLDSLLVEKCTCCWPVLG